MRPARAGSYNGMIGPLQAVRNRHISRCQVDQTARDEEGRHAPRPFLLQDDRSFGNAGKTSDTGPDHHAAARLFVVGRRIPARILKRLARSAHGEDDEIVDLALLLRLHPLVGIEAAVRAVATPNLTGDLRRRIANVDALDAPCPAVAVDEALPGRLDAASERCHHAEPCDDDASHLRFLSPQPISYSPAAARAPSNLRSQKIVKVRPKWRR